MCSAEAYWVWDRKQPDRSNCHIWIGAKNENGREWLNEVLSQANETGFYGQPRLDPELIDLLPAGDVWITTACIAGWKYREESEERLLKFYQDLYDKHGDNFMFEVQYHNTPSQKQLNQYILGLRESIPAPIIMGCDSHYISADGGQERSDFLASKEMNYPDEEGWYLDYPDGDEAVRRFEEQGVLTDREIAQAIDQTNVFLQVEEYDCDIFNDDVKLFSLHPNWTQEQKDAEYERLVYEGWEREKPSISPDKIPIYEAEIKKEVDTVKQCKMADYFIDDYHIMRRGKEKGGHLTSTGRGSAVSFYTNKLLGFTEVDRIASKVHMYPERFMTAERILETRSLPDIDQNVAEQDIFAEAQAEICGADHAVQMIAYGTQKKSAAWKMFAKSQGIDFQTSNEISNQLKKYEDKLKHASEDDKDDINVYDFIDRRFHEIYRKSEVYQGVIVSWSPAPCAFLLYQGSIRRKIGLVKIKDRICCLMDGHWAEENHFLKNDLLRVAVVDLIHKGYERAGVPLPSVTELLEMCHPDDPCWDIYKKGCTIGINQVEQPGTSSRVGTYAPKNISELCAFVAAIRPGFKSMYKTFESRQDFSYNVESFDNLLRTEEMPQSFCLYQEQQMAAMHFAGFPMTECYAAIKDIAKKRAEKVLAYKDRFIKGFSEALIREENLDEDDANEKSRMVWQILEDSARYSFNASHSYCVSLDSLYGAWLKAHHPYAFYETYMRIMDEKGDKEKLTAARDEAMSYFNIKFPPFRFGQDNRNILADEEKGEINNALTMIKGFGKPIAAALYEAGQQGFTRLTDVLLFLRQRGFKKAITEPLAKISYFQQFGNDREVLNIISLIDEFQYGECASYARSRVDGSFMQDIVSKHADGFKKDGSPATRYSIKSPRLNELKEQRKTINKRAKQGDGAAVEELTVVEDAISKETLRINTEILRECEKAIKAAGISDLPFRTKIQNQEEILGAIDLTTGKEEDRRLVLVSEIYPLISKDSGKPWGYALFTQSLGSGKKARLTLRSRLFDQQPVRKHSIIYASKCSLNKSGYWYLDNYHVVNL